MSGKPRLSQRKRRARRKFAPPIVEHELAVEDDGPRFLTKHQVLDRVGVSFPALWQWMRDGKFPRARVVGNKSMWLASEIDAWIESRPVRRLKGDPATAEVA